MTPRRRTLLRSIHNLALWAEVVQSEDKSPDFDSGTDLMRQFWQNRRREVEKAGISATERDALINKLVDYMESGATLSAPIRLIQSHEKLATELQTLNVLHASKRTVSFCHQSYLDFLIASRVADQIGSGPEAVIEWLGDPSQQSLFRREQLRQLLFLLAEDDPECLATTLERLLRSDDLRFHIKQLAVEAVGQLKPTTAIVDSVIKLTESENWRLHVLYDILNRNVEWLKAFHNRGRLFEWLLSSEETLRNIAVWLLNSVAESCPSLLSEALAATKLDGKQEILRGILHYSKPKSEPDDVFGFRVQCLKNDTDPPYISWKEIAEERPDRAVRLIAVFLDNPPPHLQAKRVGCRLEMDGSGDLKAMTRAARRCPHLVIRLLMPSLTSVASTKIIERRAWKNRATSESPPSYPSTRYPKILLRLITGAVRSLARKSPQKMEELSTQLSGISSRSVQALLLRGWTETKPASADAAINWLLSNLGRLRCGPDRKKPRWCAAAALIERMSPHCSDVVFRRLEHTLLRYRDPDEKRLAGVWLRQTREGYFRSGFFAAQHFLLPSLDKNRRSLETTGRIGCLQEKFGSDAESQFLRPRARGGFIGSPLNADRLDRISDKQWLRLIGNGEVPRRDGPWRQRYRSKSGLIESSVETFSRDIGIAAKRDPERFGRLVLKFPPDAAPDYLAQVLRALQQEKPGNEVPSEMRASWQAASRECIERVLEQATFPEDTDTMRSFCWLVRDRGDIHPSESVIDRLLTLTRHPDPEPDSLVVHCDKAASEVGIEELEQNAINCVRSLAAIAVSSLLFNYRELFGRFRPALERLIHDEHPVVRTAMVEVCLPVWNIDRKLAVGWFRGVCESDFRLACGHYAQHVFNHAFPTFADQLSPLVEAMCKSSDDAIAERGAKEATARWLFFGLFSDLVLECRNGSEALRIGVTSIVAQFVRDKEYASRCWPILLELCDDPSSEVRVKAARALHDERILSTVTSPESLQPFITTQAFQDDPDCLIDALQDHPGSLVPFAELVCGTVTKSIEIVRSPDRKPASRMPMLDQHLSTVLLRLYEQADRKEHASIRGQCLDMFDELLQHRITSAKSLLDKVRQ